LRGSLREVKYLYLTPKTDYKREIRESNKESLKEGLSAGRLGRKKRGKTGK